MTDPSPQRQRILESAVEILARAGQAGLTVRAVARASDCSTTGIYTYFGGKQGLLDAIFIDGFVRFRAHVGQGDAATAQSPMERLQSAAVRYWEWALANPTHYLLMFAAPPSQFKPSEAALHEASLGYQDLVKRVELLHPDGSREEHDAEAFHLWATLHGYVMLEMSRPSDDVTDALGRCLRAVSGALDTIAGQPAGAPTPVSAPAAPN